jgi:hypothetical protein
MARPENRCREGSGFPAVERRDHGPGQLSAQLERRAGQLLAQMDKAQGARGSLEPTEAPRGRAVPRSKRSAAGAAGDLNSR